MDFQILEYNEYDTHFPFYKYPHEIGTFSVRGDREVFYDTQQLKYLYLPKNMGDVSMDLNDKSSEVIKKDLGNNEKMDRFLKWISDHQKVVKDSFFKSTISKMELNFVCFRGLLTHISGTLHEIWNDWTICATKYKSVIYLCEFDSEQTIEKSKKQGAQFKKVKEREEMMSSWGHKFEQYMVADTLNSVPDLSVPKNEKEEFNSVVKSQLTRHNILFCAEMDAVDPEYLKNPSYCDFTSLERYVELKTSNIKMNKETFFGSKLLKWWLQCFITGVPRVICGFRNDKGIVRQIRNYNVNEMPELAGRRWSPVACLNFCSAFLDIVKECVIMDDPLSVYKFTWKLKTKIITCEELGKSSDFRIIPDWYIEKLTI